MLHVLHHSLHPYMLFNLLLGLEVERVRIERRDLALSGEISIDGPLSCLRQKLGESLRVVLGGRGQFGLSLHGENCGQNG